MRWHLDGYNRLAHGIYYIFNGHAATNKHRYIICYNNTFIYSNTKSFILAVKIALDHLEGS